MEGGECVCVCVCVCVCNSACCSGGLNACGKKRKGD